MVHHTLSDRTLALAGVFQAAGLVQQAATRGSADPGALEISLRSLFQTDPPNTAAVFGGAGGVRLGLQWLRQHLSEESSLHKAQVVKYVIGVLYLERRLSRRPEMLRRIGDAVESARRQSEHFPVTHGNVIANLAGCYSDTLSTLTPRIIVTGEHGHLSKPDTANTVRALLLAAIRAAVLWRQCGGNRWQLLLGRRKLLAEAQRLLSGA
jgi:high frequency lysogenization protein